MSFSVCMSYNETKQSEKNDRKQNMINRIPAV